jgi:DNA-directed RNA polymerase alpha subunit
MRKVCENGHLFDKTSNCPICPICDKIRQKSEKVFVGLSAPAQRALMNNGIYSLQDLSNYGENQLLQFHGLGKSSIPKLKRMLQDANLHFKI